MGLRTQLSIAVVGIALLAFALGELWVKLSAEQAKTGYQTELALLPVLTGLGRLQRLADELAHLVAEPTGAGTLDRRERYARLDTAIAETWEGLRGLAQRSPSDQTLSLEMSRLVAAFRNEAREIEQNHGTGANVTQPSRAREDLQQLLSLSLQMALTESEHHQRRAESVITELGGLSHALRIVAMLIAAAAALFISRKITRPIAELQQAVHAIASGKSGVTLSVRAPQEIQRLVDEFNSMSAKLKATTVSRAYVELVIDSMQEAVVVIGVSGRIHLANRAASELLGYSRDSLLGLQLDSLIARLSDDAGAAPLSGLVNSHCGSQELFVRHAKGTEIPVRLSLSKLGDGGGREEPEYVCVAQDLRGQQEAQRELRQYRHKLQHAQQLASLGTLSAMVAHRINQPLTSMRLFLQQALRMLHGEGTASQAEESLRDSLEEIERVSTTVSDLLRYTRRPIENKSSGINLERIAVKTTQVLRPRASDAEMALQVKDMSLLPSIDGAQDELEEMFFILTQNAIEAASQDRASQLTITGVSNGDSVEIVFADTGSGIPNELLPSIFDEFFTTKPRGKGTGLGLSIVRQIVRHHDGTINVESEPGKGTRFTVRLPVQSPEREGRVL